MEDIIDTVKNAPSDIEKIDIIKTIKDDKTKEKAIMLLEDDNNKLLMAKTLEHEYARARIYLKLLKNEELLDTIIDYTKEFNNQRYAIQIIKTIPMERYEKTINALADIYIGIENADEFAMEEATRVLKTIFYKLTMANPQFTFVAFLEKIKNDYAKASVITNITNPEVVDEYAGKLIINGLPNNMEEKRKSLVTIEDEELRKKVDLIYSTPEELQELMDVSNVKPIGLPEEMTLGTEIEAEGELTSVFRGAKIFNKWVAVEDGSLRKGVEIVSPILHDTQNDMIELYMICEIMKRLGLITTERCGGHVHIGAKYLDTKQSFANFITLWLANEETIFRICNPSGEKFRDGTNHYAKPISIRYGDVDKTIFKAISEAKTRDELVKIIQNFQRSHYNGLNLDNINSKEKDTIEFRISNGTLDFFEIQNNKRLYGRLMQRSKEMAVLQEKIENISEEEHHRLLNFERLCNPEYKKEKDEQLLIDFLFKEDERSIYVKRFNDSGKNLEDIQQMFNLEAYEKLYQILKPKEKDFTDVLRSLKSLLKDESEVEKDG